MSLKERLSSVKMGTSTVADYLRSIRVIAGELALIGHPTNDLDLVITALNGLRPAFREFTASIRACDSPLSFDELYEKLVDFEIFLQQDDQHSQSVPITANYMQRSGSNNSRGGKSSSRGPSHHHNDASSNTTGGNSKRPVCM